MALNDYGQCLDCGRVYSNPYTGDKQTPKARFRMLPEERQPPYEERVPYERNVPKPLLDAKTKRGTPHHMHVSKWEGHNVSHGYCKDCYAGGSPELQFRGYQRDQRARGMSDSEAVIHWWWQKPNFNRLNKRKNGL